MLERLRPFVFLAVLVAICAQPAGAVTALGDPFFDASWGLRMWQDPNERWWNNVAVGQYDYLRVDISFGDYGSVFEPPVFRKFNIAGWHQHGSTATFADTFGPRGTYPQFDMVFSGSPAPGGTRIHFACYRGSELRMAQLVYFSGSGGYVSSQNITREQWDPGVVPEPGTLMLLGSVLLGAAGAAVRRRLS